MLFKSINWVCGWINFRRRKFVLVNCVYTFIRRFPEQVLFSGKTLFLFFIIYSNFYTTYIVNWGYMIAVAIFLLYIFFKHHPHPYASLAQWQSTSLVNWRSWVQFPEEAYRIFYLCIITNKIFIANRQFLLNTNLRVDIQGKRVCLYIVDVIAQIFQTTNRYFT